MHETVGCCSDTHKKVCCFQFLGRLPRLTRSKPTHKSERITLLLVVQISISLNLTRIIPQTMFQFEICTKFEIYGRLSATPNLISIQGRCGGCMYLLSTWSKYNTTIDL